MRGSNGAWSRQGRGHDGGVTLTDYDIVQYEGVIAGMAELEGQGGGHAPPQIFENQLALPQPRGADHAPRFLLDPQICSPTLQMFWP